MGENEIVFIFFNFNKVRKFVFLSFALDVIRYKGLFLAHRIEICSKMFRKHHLT